MNSEGKNMFVYLDIKPPVSDIEFIGDWGFGVDEQGRANLPWFGLVQMTTRMVEGEKRYYYAAYPPYRLIIVTWRKPIEAYLGHIVDASIGWDDGHPGYVLEGNEGKRHSKLTIRKLVSNVKVEHADLTLSQIIKKAPRSDRPGGARGAVGRKRIDSEPVETHSVTMSPRYWKVAEELGGGNRSKGIRMALDIVLNYKEVFE